MYHSILIAFSFVVLLLSLPLMAHLFRPGVSRLGVALQTISAVPFRLRTVGKVETARQYRKQIPLGWGQYTLLSLALLTNIVILILGFYGVTEETVSIIAGLILAVIGLSALHLWMIRLSDR